MSGSERGPRPAESLAAALIAGLAFALLLAPALFGSRSTLSFPLSDARLDLRPWTQPATQPQEPVNLLTPDVDLYVLPGLIRVQQLRAAGQSTAWEPRQLLGYALTANMPLPLEQPLVALLSRLDPVDALDWLLWLHLALGAALAYRAARILGLGVAAAGFAATGFSLSVWMGTHWHLPHILYALAFWPGLLGAWGWMLRGRYLRATLEGALFAGLAMLSFMQVASVLLAGLALLVVCTAATRTRPALASLAVIALLAFALGAPQLLESGRSYAESLRGSPETRAATAAQGLRPGALFGLLLPDFFGQATAFSSPAPPAPTLQEYWPHRTLLGDDPQENPIENALHPGLLVLLLLPLLLRRGQCGHGRRLLALGTGALLFALAWPWLVASLPGLTVVGAGNAKRLTALTVACWPFAAAFALPAAREALHAAADSARGYRRSLLIVMLAWLVLLALPGPLLVAWGGVEAEGFVADLRPQRLRAALLLLLGFIGLQLARRGGPLALLPAVLLAADLGVHSLRFNPFPPQQEPFPATAATEALAQRPGRYVIFGQPNLLPPGAGAVLGLSSAQGVAVLVLRRSAELLAALEGPLFDTRDPRVARPLLDPESLTHPLLDLLAVDTVVHATPGLSESTGLPTLFELPEEGLAALARPTAGPRAFTTTGVQVVEEAAQRLALLGDRERDPHATALVARALRGEFPALGRARPARLVVDEAARRVLVTDEDQPSLLVLVESWDPGWSVTVNGRPADVLEVNHALLGVELAAGSHEVEWRYTSAAEGPARGISLAGWALLAGGAVVLWRRERRAGVGRPFNPADRDPAVRA